MRLSHMTECTANAASTGTHNIDVCVVRDLCDAALGNYDSVRYGTITAAPCAPFCCAGMGSRRILLKTHRRRPG